MNYKKKNKGKGDENSLRLETIDQSLQLVKETGKLQPRDDPVEKAKKFFKLVQQRNIKDKEPKEKMSLNDEIQFFNDQLMKDLPKL